MILEAPQPLLQRLLQRQQLQADALALGATTTPQAELVGGDGQQAQELANQILLSLHLYRRPLAPDPSPEQLGALSLKNTEANKWQALRCVVAN